MSYTARTIIARGDLPNFSMPHFPLKVQLPKKVREGTRAEGGRLGLFAVAGSKKKKKKGPLNKSA